jgi:hypothetical protein
MTVFAIFAVTVLLAGAGTGWWLRGPRAEPQAVFHVIRCGRCCQKVRYPAHKAGGAGLCPRCLRCLVLPKTPQPLAMPQRPYRAGERLLCGARRSA